MCSQLYILMIYYMTYMNNEWSLGLMEPHVCPGWHFIVALHDGLVLPGFIQDASVLIEWHHSCDPIMTLTLNNTMLSLPVWPSLYHVKTPSWILFKCAKCFLLYVKSLMSFRGCLKTQKKIVSELYKVMLSGRLMRK